MIKYLISIETVKIKEYIFSTNKLKIIRGASYLLDHVNRKEVPGILKLNGIKDDDIIYVNAGNAKFFVDTEEKAKKIIVQIKECYKQYAPGAKMAASYEKYDKEKGKIWDLFDAIAAKTAVQKNIGFNMLNVDLPFIEKCSFCDSRPANYKLKDLKDNELKGQIRNMLGLDINDASHDRGFCEECLKKIEASNILKEEKKESVSFYSTFYKDFIIEENIDDFKQADDISDYQNNKSFIGFMYADGDGLGDFLKNIKEIFVENVDEDNYLKFYKDFSKELDNITKNSLIEVMKDMRKMFPEVKEEGNPSGKKHYGEFLIVGGDDVCAVFPPELVFEISEQYQRKFQENFNSKIDEWKKEYSLGSNKEIPNITTSCGVVIAKAKTPMYYLFDLSLELQKKAKKSRYAEYKDLEKNNNVIKKSGFIDFQVIGSEGTVNLNDFRESVGIDKRNYIIDNSLNSDKKANAPVFREQITLIQKLKQCDFPKNKLRKFYELKKAYNNNEFMLKMEVLIFVEKLDKDQKEVAKKLLYGNGDFSDQPQLDNIYDVLELYDFINTTDSDKEGEDE